MSLHSKQNTETEKISFWRNGGYILITWGAAIDENFVKMIYSFQCYRLVLLTPGAEKKTTPGRWFLRTDGQ